MSSDQMDYPRPDWTKPPPPRRRRRLPLLTSALVVAIGLALGVGLAWFLGQSGDEAALSGVDTDGSVDDGESASDLAADGNGSDTTESESTSTTVDNAAAPEAETTGTSIVDGPPPDGIYLDAILDVDAVPGDGLFTLSGRLPDTPESSGLLRAIGVAYAPFAEIDVALVEGAANEPWMVSAERIIPLLGSITSGAVRIHGDGVSVEGTGSPAEAEVLAGAVTALAGDLPVDTANLSGANLAEPSYEATVDDGTITLSGNMPNEAIAEAIVVAAEASYGPANVTNNFVITDEVHSAFWIHTVPAGIATLANYPGYHFVVADGGIVADVRSDFAFAFDSAELSEDATSILPLWHAILLRAPTSVLTITGHTDSDGTDAHNLALSEARAEAYKAELVAIGVPEERIVAVGLGESEPAAPNDTDANKALNRRVEFAFGMGG